MEGGRRRGIRKDAALCNLRMTKQELTDHTLVVWQSRTPRRLSNEDAREITENLTGFFAILTEWSRQEERDGSETKTSRGADA